MPERNSVVATLPASVRPYLDAHLPPWLQVRWWATRQQALALASGAEIGWFDMYDKEGMVAAVMAATDMRWLSSMIAGMERQEGACRACSQRDSVSRGNRRTSQYRRQMLHFVQHDKGRR